MAQTTRASKEKLRISWGKRWLDALNNYHTVYFEVDSADIDRVVQGPSGPPVDQGKALEDWIKTLKFDRVWIQALGSGKVPVSGVAYASVPCRKCKTPQEKRAYNYKKSEQRRDAVVRRLQDQLGLGLDTKQVRAPGMIEAQREGEDVRERRCTIQVDGIALAREVGKLRQKQL